MYHVVSALLSHIRISKFCARLPVPHHARLFEPLHAHVQFACDGLSEPQARQERCEPYSVVLLQRLAHPVFHMRLQRDVLCFPLSHEVDTYPYLRLPPSRRCSVPGVSGFLHVAPSLSARVLPYMLTEERHQPRPALEGKQNSRWRGPGREGRRA